MNLSVQAHARVDTLRQILRDAARDGFGSLQQPPPDLGSRLRLAADRVLSVLGDKADVSLSAWRHELGNFEGLEPDDQAVVVARGMRVIFTLGGGAGRSSSRPLAAKDPSLLAQPTTAIPGIGPALADKLAQKGIETVEDLVWHIPRRYDDARNVVTVGDQLAECEAGESWAIAGVIASSRFARRGRRRWVEVKLVTPPDEVARGQRSGSVLIRWFNAHPGMASRFVRGSRAVVSGKLTVRGGSFELANPDILEIETPDGTVRKAPARILPRYPEVAGVGPAILRKSCAEAAHRSRGIIDDGVPAEVIARCKLPTLDEALSALHRPPDSTPEEEITALCKGDSRWHRRLAFGDLFLLGVAVAQRRRHQRADRSVAFDADVSAKLDAALPFRLTGAQSRAIAAISADLGKTVPMNRLLQGDVGAGKTAVALAAAAQVAASGGQIAFMVPTEILAGQHFSALEPLCKSLGIRSALVTAATPKPIRATTTSLLAAGEIDLVIGTHALLAQDMGFARLGLVIIDEQHRFGVAQRVRLRNKGDGGAPHLLVMTATPIPRTLALTAYGDLDLVLLDEMPPGRQPTRTRVLQGKGSVAEAEQAVAKTLERGQRAFWVCPLVEAGGEEVQEWSDATTRAEQLAARFGPAAVGLVHGRLAQAERDEVMRRFRDGDVRILVATTVIEVGIDVPSATIIVVEDADRFGLAQLHQLRGRVGRGGGESTCLLINRRGKSETSRRRLATMEATCDGFEIAEEDLAIRGPGEVFGIRQAGLPKLRFGDLVQHVALLAQAREEAERVVELDPDLGKPEHAALKKALDQRLADAEVYGAESG